MNPYPRLAQILLLTILAVFLAQIPVQLIGGIYSPHVALLAAEGALIAFAALFIRRYRMVPEDILLLNAVRLPALVAAAVAAVSAGVLIGDLDLRFSALLAALDLDRPLYIQRHLLEIQLGHDLRGAGLVLASVVAAPALAEELFFRGLVFTGLCAHHGARAGIVGSALLFAAAHLTPWQFPALFVFGLFLAALVYWTHSIYPAILAHALNNLVSAGSVNLRTHLGIELLSTDQYLPLPAAALALVVLVGSVLLLRRCAPFLPLPGPPAAQPDTTPPARTRNGPALDPHRAEDRAATPGSAEARPGPVSPPPRDPPDSHRPQCRPGA